MERAIPDIDVDGFVSLDDLASRARAYSRPDRDRVYNVPGLFVPPPGEGTDGKPISRSSESGRNARLEASYKRTADDDQKLPDPMVIELRYAGRVAFLTKRPGQPFPDIVSVGRALNCDIVLSLASVSKIHGLFHRESGGKWSYTDQKSRNGSFHNKRKLAADARTPLADGDLIQIGLDLEVVFLEPKSLFARLGLA
jgi:hypothetical protein